MVPFPFEFIVIQIAVAMVSIIMLKELSERYQLIRSSFFILLAYSLMYIGLVMHQEGNINKIDPVVFIYFFINFIFILFSYSLVYLIEKSFGFISGVSLIELSNINKPLLKELSEKAFGNFSTFVAGLQPGHGRRNENRSQCLPDKNRCALSRYRENGQSRLLYRESIAQNESACGTPF